MVLNHLLGDCLCSGGIAGDQTLFRGIEWVIGGPKSCSYQIGTAVRRELDVPCALFLVPQVYSVEHVGKRILKTVVAFFECGKLIVEVARQHESLTHGKLGCLGTDFLNPFFMGFSIFAG